MATQVWLCGLAHVVSPLGCSYTSWECVPHSSSRFYKCFRCKNDYAKRTGSLKVMRQTDLQETIIPYGYYGPSRCSGPVVLATSARHITMPQSVIVGRAPNNITQVKAGHIGWCSPRKALFFFHILKDLVWCGEIQWILQDYDKLSYLVIPCYSQVHNPLLPSIT